ncbi:MAG: hypothetical protein ACFBSE_24135 [Prochloraceae cyanobacterium]
MKVKNAIELHHSITPLLIWGLMVTYKNFNQISWIYFALHGTYSFISLFFDYILPNENLDKEIPTKIFFNQFFTLGLYWVIPIIIISNFVTVSTSIVVLSILLNIFGIVILFTNKVRQNFVNKYEKGLEKEKEVNQCQNKIYFGEMAIYFSFALLSKDWISFFILSLLLVEILVDNDFVSDFNSNYKNYNANQGFLFMKFKKK